jgi:hypothetical protein
MADHLSMSSFTSSLLTFDTGILRTVTSLHVFHSADTLTIQTTLYGLEPQSISVTLYGLYILVEGTLKSTKKLGRYARSIPELGQEPRDVVEIAYEDDGRLTIVLKLKPKVCV